MYSKILAMALMETDKLFLASYKSDGKFTLNKKQSAIRACKNLHCPELALPVYWLTLKSRYDCLKWARETLATKEKPK